MPGTRFVFKTSKTIGGATVQLRHKGLWLSKGDTSAITGQIMRARGMLSATIAAIYHAMDSKAKAHAATYFLTPGTGPSDTQRRQIMAILELTYHGLSNDMTLKLGGDGDFGFVTRHSVGSGSPGAVAFPDGTHWSRDGHAIHVSKKRMLANAEIGVITLIHEATHKFGNTFDHGDAGYREEDDSGWWEPGLTMDQALVNADSHAYFVYRVGSDNGW